MITNNIEGWFMPSSPENKGPEIKQAASKKPPAAPPPPPPVGKQSAVIKHEGDKFARVTELPDQLSPADQAKIQDSYVLYKSPVANAPWQLFYVGGIGTAE